MHRDRRRGYRRGLLLGFTISEVMLLLVFALLLSLGVVIKRLTAELQNARVEIDEYKPAADDANDCTRALAEVGRAVMGSNGNDFDEWFAELRLVANKAKKWDRVSEAVPGLSDDTDIIKRLTECVIPANGEKDQRDKAAQCQQDLEQCNRKLADAEKQIPYWIEKAKTVAGRGGLDYPPCWPDAGSKPVYVFEIVIFDNDLAVKDVVPEERRSDLERFGLDPSLYGEPQSVALFETRTRGVVEQGKQDNCRHFVRVIDRTTTKEAYKAGLQTIERHFYKFEPGS